MAKINEIDITSLTFQEGSAPTTPASTKWKIYTKTDGLYVIDDAGTETGPLGGGSSGGSWAGTIVPPASPGADDDEFDGANGVGTPPGWTLLATSGNQTITEANDVLSVAFDSQLSNDFNGIAKSATISTGKKVTTAVKTLLRGNFDLVGVGFTDGTASTSNAIAATTYVASTRLEVWTGTLQAMTGVKIDTVNRDSFISPLFLQLEYVSANTFSARVSPDGVSWVTYDASRSYTFTPTHMALFWSAAGGATVNIATFDFIRLS